MYVNQREGHLQKLLPHEKGFQISKLGTLSPRGINEELDFKPFFWNVFWIIFVLKEQTQLRTNENVLKGWVCPLQIDFKMSQGESYEEMKEI